MAKTEEFPTTDRDVVIGRGPMLAPRPTGLVNYRKAVKAHRVSFGPCGVLKWDRGTANENPIPMGFSGRCKVEPAHNNRRQST